MWIDSSLNSKDWANISWEESGALNLKTSSGIITDDKSIRFFTKIKKHSKKESRIYDFSTFINEGRKEKLEINKEIKKMKREEQLKSGANLTTKVIPDKKKQYKRKKKVDLNED